MRARDVSNYTDNNIEELMAQWYAEGDRLVIIQAFPPTHRNYSEQQRQIAAAVAQGMAWDAYIYDYLASPDWRDAALVGISADSPRMVWLDEEDTTANSMSQRQKVDAIRESIVAAARGNNIGIYTAAWWWGPNTGDADNFCLLPLWAAQYDGIPDATVFMPFGGWTECAIKQYAGSQPDGTDLNVLSEALVAELTAEPTTEEPMPDEPTRETPEEWPWPTWREAAINYKGIADALGQQTGDDSDAERKLAQIKEIVAA